MLRPMEIWSPFQNRLIGFTLGIFFHEMAHIPDWQDGSLTTLKYIRDALLSAASYATKAGDLWDVWISGSAGGPFGRDLGGDSL